MVPCVVFAQSFMRLFEIYEVSVKYLFIQVLCRFDSSMIRLRNIILMHSTTSATGIAYVFFFQFGLAIIRTDACVF